MSGLLMKDYRLLLKRKKFFVLLIVIMLVLGGMMDGSFTITYMPLLVTVITISTISYDELDNGMLFLMSLPVEAKDYAIEKYVLGLIMGGGSTLLAFVVQLVALIVKGESISIGSCILAALVTIPIWLLMLAVLLPVEIKFGPEKGRIAIFVVYGIALLIYMGGRKICAMLGVDLGGVALTLQNMSNAVKVLTVIGILLVALGVSVGISVRVMEKKEF